MGLVNDGLYYALPTYMRRGCSGQSERKHTTYRCRAPYDSRLARHTKFRHKDYHELCVKCSKKALYAKALFNVSTTLHILRIYRRT